MSTRKILRFNRKCTVMTVMIIFFISVAMIFTVAGTVFWDDNQSTLHTQGLNAKHEGSLAGGDHALQVSMALPRGLRANSEHEHVRREESIETQVGTPSDDVADKQSNSIPADHDVLPQPFEAALSAVRTSNVREFYIALNADIFTKLTRAQVGEPVDLEFVDGTVVGGVMGTLKTYPNSLGVLKGVVDLVGQNAKMHFFTSKERTTAEILFDEKSKALVYEQSDGPAIFVEMPISDLFCSDEKVTVYHFPSSNT
ncbi:MAG: hypothetical protein KTR16_10325 [Acidiferrobacterales bacterium]|nr:hypothetical protein [Acidiferrobacterales bacterium]